MVEILKEMTYPMVPNGLKKISIRYFTSLN